MVLYLNTFYYNYYNLILLTNKLHKYLKRKLYVLLERRSNIFEEPITFG